MLPKVDVPIYELKLLSQKKPVRFRPFLVKEQKLLLMAQESMQDDGGENDATLNVVKQIITNCVLSEIEVDDLPMFDIEYLFLNLRARSMGEVVNLSYRCMKDAGNDENGQPTKCNNIMNYELNLLNIKPKAEGDHSNRIVINDSLGLIMRYPNLNMFNSMNQDDDNFIINLIFLCIESIYDAETVYYTKDVERSELEEFVDSLPTSVIEEIKKFFDSMPKIKEVLHFKCNKCQHEEDILIEGLNSFFE